MSIDDERLRVSLRARTDRLAVAITLRQYLDVMDQASPLACDLIAAGIDSAGVLAVAQLSPQTTWRDGRDAVMSMLTDLSYAIAEPLRPSEEWSLLCRAFAFWNLPPKDFLGPFLLHVPGVDHQSDLDRELLLLFDEFDHETVPDQRTEVVDRMRRAVRSSFYLTSR